VHQTPSPQGHRRFTGHPTPSVNCGNFGWGHREALLIASVEYPNSLPVRCFGDNVASVDFLAPRGYEVLVGTIGVEDNTENASSSVEFSVLNAITGEYLLTPTTLTYGQAGQRVSVQLSGATRVRLETKYSQVGESSLITAVWADMKFTS
jgi:hypothetical protein